MNGDKELRRANGECCSLDWRPRLGCLERATVPRVRQSRQRPAWLERGGALAHGPVLSPAAAVARWALRLLCHPPPKKTSYVPGSLPQR